MDTPEIIVKQSDRRAATSSSFWKWLTLAVIAAAVAATMLRKCETDKEIATLKTKADSTGKVATVEREKRQDAQVQIATLKQQNADEQAAYVRSLALVEADKQRIAEWAKSLSTKRQIGEIAKTLPTPFQGDSVRIQNVYTPADSALIAELYRKVQERELFAVKLDSANRLVSVLSGENERLRANEGVYKRALAGVRDALLSEAETARFLGIGRRVAMRKLAKAVGKVATDPNAVSDLEKELNGH